ncbi:MAG: type 4a pilus biogenesis protein PilO [Candidatus Nealsonbacteria bacterium]|nr:type 4a pilus biogenesis protein PilO [Candidatus Nealsonbacteria bacterium]
MLRKSIIIVVMIVPAFIFFLLFVLPEKDALKDLKSRVQEKEQELKMREDYFKDLENIAKGLAEYQSQLAKIKLALPEGPQTLVFYNFLQKSASQAGLVLKSIDYQLFDKTISLNLGVAGTVDGFRNFLAILEESARMISIESFSFTSPEREKDLVNFNLKIKAYFVD